MRTFVWIMINYHILFYFQNQTQTYAYVYGGSLCGKNMLPRLFKQPLSCVYLFDFYGLRPSLRSIMLAIFIMHQKKTSSYMSKQTPSKEKNMSIYPNFYLWSCSSMMINSYDKAKETEIRIRPRTTNARMREALLSSCFVLYYRLSL